MRTRALLVFLALPAAAQNVVGTASRTITITADEAVIDVNAVATADVPFDAVLRALQPAGVRREHLTSLTLAPSLGRIAPGPLPGGPAPGSPLVYSYSFSLIVPVAESSQVVERLQEFSRGPVPGLVTWNATGSWNVSDAALDVNRIAQLATLFDEARRRAGEWRQAAGITQDTVVFANDSFNPVGSTVILAGAIPTLLSRGVKAAYTVSVRLGQGPRSVAVAASKLVTLAPEEATFRVLVDAMPGVTAEQILEALAPAGFTRADLQTINSQGADAVPTLPPGVPPPTIPVLPSTVTFDLMNSRDAGGADQVVRALDQLQRSLPRGIVSIRFGLGMRVSPATIDLLRQSVTPELLEKARRKAGDLVPLMGGRLGALISFGEGGTAGGFVGSFPGSTPIVPSNLRILTAVTAQYAVE